MWRQGGDDVNPDPSTMNTTDGSFGDPGVRIAQFVHAFQNSVLASICDASYASSMQAIATKLGQLITPPCITGKIADGHPGQPMCSVVEHLTDMQGNKKDIALQNCNENGARSPAGRDHWRDELQRLPRSTSWTRRGPTPAPRTARSTARFVCRPRRLEPAARLLTPASERTPEPRFERRRTLGRGFRFWAADIAPRA